MALVSVRRKKKGKGIAGIGSLRPGPNRVKVGFPAGEADQDVINHAIWNNFGTQHIPERPFMQNAMRDNRASYKAAMKTSASTIMEQVALGKRPADEKRKALKRLGIKAQGDIQAEITSLRSPPNAPSTIRQKGSSNPLIDTGEMRNAVAFKIEEK
ncbi:UNVERIFIED_ORG: hypothetical protein J2W66_003166 [Agrobacterium larrymoorei]|nr:hypothetical protein [Agrobacterium larrymoorei]